MYEITDFKNNEINKKMLKTFERKSLLFLENDNSLSSSVGNFHRWCVHNKIETNSLFKVGELPMEYIKKQIDYFDVIVFQTQWVYEISKQLEQHLSTMKDKKIVIECYIHEPSWWHKPKVVHDVFVLNCPFDDMDDWEFHKLRINKGIWEK